MLCGAQTPAHLDAFPTQAATADALQFFDTLNAGPHGANNGALYDASKHPKPQFKVAGGQQLSSKYAHHGYSTQVFSSARVTFRVALWGFRLPLPPAVCLLPPASASPCGLLYVHALH